MPPASLCQHPATADAIADKALAITAMHASAPPWNPMAAASSAPSQQASVAVGTATASMAGAATTGNNTVSVPTITPPLGSVSVPASLIPDSGTGQALMIARYSAMATLSAAIAPASSCPGGSPRAAAVAAKLRLPPM